MTEHPRVDFSQPSSARIYDYFLSGKDNYDVDRAAAEKILEVWPTVKAAVQFNREFMVRTTHELSALGVRQFLDIGTGIPTEPNLHQVAQQLNPEARVVYVDNDPLVLSYARALLRGTPEGRTAYIDADLTDPDAILNAPELRETLDLQRPVALSLIAVLHFLSDEQDPRGILNHLMDALPPNSFLVISHITTDFDPPTMERALATYTASGIYAQGRNRDEVTRFFDGYDLLEPGVVGVHRWRNDDDLPQWRDAEAGCWGGVARKRG